MIYQAGKYVVRAEDIPRARKLPCAQNLENTLENIKLHMWGVARVVVLSAKFDGKKYLPRAGNKLSSLDDI